MVHDEATTDCTPLACNAAAFTAGERLKWRQLGKRLLDSAREQRDLPNGFAFDIDRTPETLRDLAEFVEFESRCCPFVDFTVSVKAGGRYVVFEMTGAEGVREILAAELDLAPRP